MSLSTSDPALATLWLPFAEHQLPWPDSPVLFLRARTPLPEFARQLMCTQTWKPDADALLQAGLPCLDPMQALTQQHALTLLLPPRQRNEARALLAQAVQATQQHGHVVISAVNNEGARSLQDDLCALTGNINVLSKHKCRVCWSRIDRQQINTALLEQWLQGDAIRAVADTPFVSRPGVFAWDRIDMASRLLMSCIPDSLGGSAADLGCGFGYLASELLARCSGISQLDVYEAEARALELARLNLQSHQNVRYHWHDVTQGLPHHYDVIISNPPFHVQQRTDRPDIGQQFIRVALQALKPRGQLWLVANRHLPYEQVFAELGMTANVVKIEKGFKVLHATKPAGTRR